MLETSEAVGEMVDGVVRDGQRAMATGVFHFELIIGVELFGRVDGHHHGLSAARVDPAAIGIERKFGIDQIAMIAQQPFDAVGAARFFVGSERENDVAIGMEIFLVETDQGCDEDRVGGFHVLRAAAVEVAIALEKLERVDRPILAARFDNVDVADQKDRAMRSGAAQAGDHVSFARIWAEDLHVAGRKSSLAQALRHSFGGRGGAAGRIGRVDFDELLENVAREPAVGVIGLRTGRQDSEKQENRARD